MHNICLFVPRRVCGILCRVMKKITGGPDLEGKKARIRGDCHCPCGFLPPRLRVELMNQTP